ncbi:MAG: hypothetical protein K2I85_00865 [Alistipes sp.]|nr:hypothetical protein [Alistipes sp.]
MKKIFRNLKFGLLLCAGAFAASCSDVEDAMDEIPYTRVLTPLNFEADVDAAVGTDIKFSWSAVSNAEGYVLELFEAEPTYTTDEKGNEVENYELPDQFDSTNAFASINVAKDEVPYTVKDLEVDKTFWARVKGASSRIEHSHWVCLTEPVSTSAVRKALNPQVKERTSTSVTLIWDNADDKGDLTSIRCDLVVPVEGATPKITPLTDEQIQACEATVEDLDPCTDYKFTLLFGKSGSRGYLTAFTRPNTEGATKISSSEQLKSAIESATGDLKLELEYNEGALYDLSGLMSINEKENIYDPFEFAHGLEIYGLSSPEGAKPAIKLAIKPTAGCNTLHFEDLLIDGGNQCGVLVTMGGSIDGDAEFVNCEITGYIKGVWSGSTGYNVTGTLLYENIYAHDINPTGAGGGDFIDIRGGDYGAIVVKNSTFYAAARTFLRVSEAATKEVGKIEVANCTFNQVTATNTSSNNSGIFHIRYTEQSKPDSHMNLGSLTLTKCVFLNELSATEDDKGHVRIARNSNENFAPTCEGNYYYNVGPAWFDIAKCYQIDGTLFSEKLALDGGGAILTDDPCTNSIAGKMYLKPNSAIAANKAGDPRWWNASAPVIVRPTELETVTEATEWDFTDKTKFDTEKIESNQIIENIRIYAPAEVVMNEGVTFGAAATLSIKNEPLTSALAFKADGAGAVEVTAQGTGITSTVQILAGGDAYSINADGKTHKVVFGDLVGANYIYILPSVPNITFTKVAWTKDLEPEDVTETLATPEITWTPEKVNAGTSAEAVASWKAVQGAASYTVVFNGSTTTITETTYTVPAATVAALDAGDYEISVVANPTETSTRYFQSEAGKAKFKVQAVGKPMKKSWIFADAAFDNIDTEIGASDTDAANTTIEGLTIKSSDKAKIKVESRNSARGIRFAKGGSATTTYFSFVVPANAASGKLTVLGRNPSGSVSEINFVASINGTEAKGAWVKNDVPVSFDISVKGGETVYVYPDQGFWFQSIVFDYIDPTASADIVWDFTEIVKSKTTLVDTTDSGDYKLNDDGTVTATTTPTATETLYLTGGGKKISTNERVCTADSKSYYPMSYGGGAAYAYFNVNGGGTVTVVAARAKEDSCVLSIEVDGTELETFTLELQDLAKTRCGAKEMSWEIPSTAKKVVVKKKSGGTSPDIYSITWTPAN